MKTLLKSAAIGAATIAVLPSLLSFWMRSAVMGADRALEGSSQTLSLVPGIIGQYLRRAFYARALARCHVSATIEFGAIFSKAGAEIDEHVYIGPRCHIGLVHLERDVLLGPAVQIPSGAQTHGTGDLSTPIREQEGSRTRVTIRAGTWIGAGTIVLADVGCDSVVGAGAVVTQPIPDRVIAGGVPAKVIRRRDAVPGASNV